METVKSQCPKCKEWVEGVTLEDWRINARKHFLNTHKSEPSWKNIEWKRWDSNTTYHFKYAKLRKQPPLTQEQLDRKRELAAKYRQARKAAEVKPLPLGTCPFCKGTFIMEVNKKQTALELDHCPSCNIRFYYAQ